MIERKMHEFQELYIPIMQMKQHIISFVCHVFCMTQLQLFRKTHHQESKHT